MAALACWALACGSPFVLNAGRYFHPEAAYSVAAPGPDWDREAVSGADLSFRRSDGARISLVRSCRRPLTDVQLMARQLLIGSGEREWLQSGPVAVAGRQGWAQTVVVRADGRAVRLRTVTVVDDPCTYDFVLASPVSVPPPDREFDAWWSTFAFDAAASQPLTAEGGA